MIIAGYDIRDVLHESSRTLIYRGQRVNNHQAVILKILNNEYPTQEELARFKREYQLTRDLKIADIITVYRLESYKNRLMIVCEDIGGESLAKTLTSRKLSLMEGLHLALRVTNTLGELHQQSIIHADINPSNIVWNPANDQVKLIDFGLAIAISRDHPVFVPPTAIEGTPAYMSPEQTGRMNRAMDYRTDFYSLGVTFYEMLVGFLPFQTTDTMELIHSHLARTPLSPAEVNKLIPQPLSDIVMKLLAKTAEERYQSARGLASDLQKCLEQLQFTGTIGYLAVGQDDISDHFQIPQQLYGRKPQIHALLEVFERIRQGRCELVVVTGDPGVGKSALVQEIHQPVVEKRGYFLTGHFDESKDHIPYFAIVQALQTFVHHILTEGETRIKTWKQRLSQAVEAFPHVLSEVIPELSVLLGEQRTETTLSPLEFQNRLSRVLHNVLRICATSHHPLVMFLNDVQWADPASLQFIEMLVTSPETRYFLLIAAYREQELDDDHALLDTLREIQDAGIAVKHLHLQPMSLPDITSLLADTFRCKAERASILADLILKKTRGNPFAVKEFLSTLYQEGLLTFDARTSQWQWNLNQIEGMSITENVIDFMTAKIQKLLMATQSVMQFAACIGNRFDLHTLALAQEKTEPEIIAALEPAIQEGLILATDETSSFLSYFQPTELREFAPQVMYDFVHSRVREAASALLSANQQAKNHLSIGRHFLRCPVHARAREEHLSDIINHLNKAIRLVTSDTEKYRYAQLNLTAAKQTKATTSQSALTYVQAGIAFLGNDCWRKYYALTFELYKEWAQIEYLTGNFEQSDRVIALAMEHTKTANEKAQLAIIRIKQYTLRTQFREAIHAGKFALSLLGIALPDHDRRAAFDAEVAEIKTRLRQKELAALITGPEMTNPDHQTAIQILDTLIIPTLQSDRDLYRLVVAKIVKMSLTYGHTPEESFGYAQYGALLGSVWGYYKAGYEFGMLAMKFSERFDHPAQRCKASYTLAADLMPWVRPLKYAQNIVREAYQAGLNAGEAQFAGLTLVQRLILMFCEGANLEHLHSKIREFLQFNQHIHNRLAEDTIEGCLLIVENLRGATSDYPVFETDAMSEQQYIARCQAHQNSLALGVYHILKMQAFSLHGFPGDALRCAADAEKFLDAVSSSVIKTVHNVFLSLSLAALYAKASKETQKQYWNQLAANQQCLKIWAENCPENFQHLYLLIEAERARLTERPFDAMRFYKQAIQTAADHGFIHHKTLAHEIAARFYLDAGFNEFAELHFREAHYGYTLWGAVRKAADLQEKYPQFLSRKIQDAQAEKTAVMSGQPGNTVSLLQQRGMSMLDLDAVMKASQAISSEIVLADLLKGMMKIVIENAGAQKGWLILPHEETWAIEAEGAIDSDDVNVLQSLPLRSDETCPASPVPTAVIYYVIQTKTPLVLHDASREGNFVQDSHIVNHQIKSILCTPLIKQGKLSGIIYLENNLMTGAFTPDRLEMLNLLTSQMLTSIENATLYKHLEEALAHQIELSNNQIAVTKAYSRFVPSEFLKLLGKESILDVQLGDQVEQEITVMFSDIRGFTSLSEKMSPQENFNFINSYLSQMSPVIQEYHGFIDKYIGDAIMALFPTNADEAVRASIAVLRRLSEYNQGRKRANYSPIQIGIGLNTGLLMLGTVGGQERMDGTVISDAVNLASRIEGMTKTYGVSLLIGESTYFQLANSSDYYIRIIDQVQAKGKAEPVTVFEVFNGDPPALIESKLKTLVLFNQGFKLYHRIKFAEFQGQGLFNEVVQHLDPVEKKKQLDEAYALFSEVLTVNPEDKVAQIYLKRCEQIQQYGVSDEWAGTWAWIDGLKRHKKQ